MAVRDRNLRQSRCRKEVRWKSRICSVSAWLPDSYPKASPAGSVFLAAFTTKAALFVLIILFAGTKVLVFAGLFMAFYGIVYAILENDMRRLLSYSIISQLGF
ncbi:MAG: hypothetical protein EBZ36_18210, partial [Acidobacteria bacterium]|nr:hypothetical protein [Acidobacteriota bacterium]